MMYFFPGTTTLYAIENFSWLVRVKVKKQVSEGRKKLINKRLKSRLPSKKLKKICFPAITCANETFSSWSEF